MWTLATHRRGEPFSLITTWENRPIDYAISRSGQIHYHGGWEVITVIDGNWIDSFYEPITQEPSSVGPKIPKYVRDEEINSGEFMAIDPYTPQDFQIGDKRDVSGILVTYIGAPRQGRRMNLDPKTGEATVAKPTH
jgi:hypothetical protein